MGGVVVGGSFPKWYPSILEKDVLPEVDHSFGNLLNRGRVSNERHILLRMRRKGGQEVTNSSLCISKIWSI